jgi:AraC-like DNA-binding protein
MLVGFSWMFVLRSAIFRPVMGATAGLQSLIESSLTFEYLEGDTREINGGIAQPVAHPFATVGQVQRRAFSIELPGGERVTVRPGEGYLLPPDVVFGYSVPGPARFVWAHVNYRVFDSLNLFHLLQCPLRFASAVGRQFAEINGRLHALPPDRALSLRAIAGRKLLGYRLLVLLLDSGAQFATDMDRLANLERLRPVLAFVGTHLGETITRAALARQAGLSETHFHSFFKQTMGVAPMEYVRRQRMQKAQRLLLQTNDNIASVAARVGFDDPFHFSRQFRAAFSLSPTEYRQRRKQRIW